MKNDAGKLKIKRILFGFCFLIFVFTFSFLVFNFVSARGGNPYPCPEPHPLLKLELQSTGDCVRHLHWYLNTLNNSDFPAGGVFDTFTQVTDTMVKDYQRTRYLNPDGDVGSSTWAVIHEEINRQTSGQPSGQQPQSTYSVPPLPTGLPLSAPGVMGFLIQFANFLIAAGTIGGIIAIVIAGIMYFRAGSDAEAKKAKAWFKNGLIGALIILGVGVIINTIFLITTGGFFSLIPGGGGGGPGGGGVPGGGTPGTACLTNNDCAAGATCRLTTGICIRIGGNVEGELCKDDNDCLQGLLCKKSGLFGTGAKKCSKP